MYGIPLSLILFLLATISMRTNRQSILLWFFAIELMLLRANLLFLTVSVMSDTLEGQLIAIYVLTVAAAESRIGLSLLVMYSRTRNTISLASFDRLKELSQEAPLSRMQSLSRSSMRSMVRKQFPTQKRPKSLLLNWKENQSLFTQERSRKYGLYLLKNEDSKDMGPKAISLERVEAARINMIRYLRRVYPESLRSFLKIRVWKVPSVPVTKKALGARMGKGKGPVYGNVLYLERNRKVPRYQILIPSTRKRSSIVRQCRILREKKLGTKVGVCDL